MTDVYLLLGANIGKREENILIAEERIAQRTGSIFKKSGVYETKSWGYESDHLFLNRTLGLKTEISPEDLLRSLKEIEKSIGREKSADVYEDRLIDIDILFYGNRILKLKHLIIPHPRLHLRRFTLVPLAEIAGDFIHPVLKENVNTLLTNCKDQAEVSAYFI